MMKKENILISACLLGTPCRYDGKENTLEVLSKLKETFHFLPVCPEVLGGLSTPRPAAEIVNGRVINQLGEDISSFFQKGAELTLKIAKEKNIKFAILKAKSPSCGFGLIYDGSFSKTLILGNGLTAELLSKNGFQIFTEIDFDNLLQKVCNESITE